MSEFLYNLKVGQTFLVETQNPEALIKKKKEVQLHKTFKCKTNKHH